MRRGLFNLDKRRLTAVFHSLNGVRAKLEPDFSDRDTAKKKRGNGIHCNKINSDNGNVFTESTQGQEQAALPGCGSPIVGDVPRFDWTWP